MDKIGKDEVANIFKKMVDDGNEDFIDTIKEIIKKKIRFIFTKNGQYFMHF